MTNTPSSTETSNNPYASPPGKRRSRSWLYLPFIIFGLLIAAYTGYWFFAKGKIETGINDFLTQQKEAGAEVTYTSKRLHGYPFRFTLTVEDPHFANPENQIGWTGEKLQINMQPWNWFHYIIRSSGRNEITANGENFTALLGPGSALSFGLDGTAGFTLDTADIVTAQGDLNTQNLKFSLVEAGVNSPGKRILMDWDFIRLSDEILSLLGEDGAFLGNEIQASRLRLEGQGFSVFGPADTRKAELAQLLLNWGPLKFGAKGKFNVNDKGYPEGTLFIRLDEAETLEGFLRETNVFEAVSPLFGPLKIASKDNGFLPLPLRDGGITMLGQQIAPISPIAPPLNADGTPILTSEPSLEPTETPE